MRIGVYGYNNNTHDFIYDKKQVPFAYYDPHRITDPWDFTVRKIVVISFDQRKKCPERIGSSLNNYVTIESITCLIFSMLLILLGIKLTIQFISDL